LGENGAALFAGIMITIRKIMPVFLFQMGITRSYNLCFAVPNRQYNMPAFKGDAC
jgi:hypothetical protein